jgi:hypothetical protein
VNVLEPGDVTATGTRWLSPPGTDPVTEAQPPSVWAIGTDGEVSWDIPFPTGDEEVASADFPAGDVSGWGALTLVVRWDYGTIG